MKRSIKDGKLISNKIFNYIFLYILFQILFTLINNGKFSLYQSQMGLWYIQILIIYMCTLPIITKIKNKYCILLSIFFGLLIGIDKSAGHIGSLSRLLVFLPFFLAGYYIEREQLMQIVKNKKYSVIIGLIALFILGIIINKMINFVPHLNYLTSGKVSYYVMKLTTIEGVFHRLIWYIIAFLMIIFTMMIIPMKKCILSKIGSRSLQIFLLHLIICVYMRKTDFYIFLGNYNDIIVIFSTILISGLITYVTSLKIFKYPFDYIMNLKFKKLLKNEN